MRVSQSNSDGYAQAWEPGSSSTCAVELLLLLILNCFNNNTYAISPFFSGGPTAAQTLRLHSISPAFTRPRSASAQGTPQDLNNVTMKIYGNALSNTRRISEILHRSFLRPPETLV